jgi:hypothetical protein
MKKDYRKVIPEKCWPVRVVIVVEYVMQKWSTDGQPYMGEYFDEYFVLYSQTRDAGLLTQSNWRTIIKYLDERMVVYRIVRFSHWLCGWIETILIHESEKKSVEVGNEITQKLSEYPIFNEDDFSDLESEKAYEMLSEIKNDISNLEPGEKLKGWSHINETMTDDEIIDTIYNYGMVTE